MLPGQSMPVLSPGIALRILVDSKSGYGDLNTALAAYYTTVHGEMMISALALDVGLGRNAIRRALQNYYGLDIAEF